MAESILLYVATEDGLIILSKPGTSKEWLPPRHTLAGQPVGAAAAVSGPPIQVVAALRSAAPEILVSSNGGRTWEPAPAGADPLAVLPTDPAPPTIAAPLQIPAMKQGVAPVLLMVADGTLQRSEDDGATWAAPELDAAAPSPVTALAPDPVRRERVYAGTLAGRIYTSADRGKTWTALEVPALPPIHHIFVLRIG
jgi:hypothetical protein